MDFKLSQPIPKRPPKPHQVRRAYNKRGGTSQLSDSEKRRLERQRLLNVRAEKERAKTKRKKELDLKRKQRENEERERRKSLPAGKAPVLAASSQETIAKFFGHETLHRDQARDNRCLESECLSNCEGSISTLHGGKEVQRHGTSRRKLQLSDSKCFTTGNDPGRLSADEAVYKHWQQGCCIPPPIPNNIISTTIKDNKIVWRESTGDETIKSPLSEASSTKTDRRRTLGNVHDMGLATELLYARTKRPSAMKDVGFYDQKQNIGDSSLNEISVSNSFQDVAAMWSSNKTATKNRYPTRKLLQTAGASTVSHDFPRYPNTTGTAALTNENHESDLNKQLDINHEEETRINRGWSINIPISTFGRKHKETSVDDFTLISGEDDLDSCFASSTQIQREIEQPLLPIHTTATATTNPISATEPEPGGMVFPIHSQKCLPEDAYITFSSIGDRTRLGGFETEGHLNSSCYPANSTRIKTSFDGGLSDADWAAIDVDVLVQESKFGKK